MSDDVFRRDGGGNNGGGRGANQITRYSHVTSDLDTIFGLLQSERRRYVLYHLYDMDGEATGFEETVDAVSAYEAAGTEAHGFPPRQEIRLDLHHTQIPRLDAEGIIDYDRRQGTIRFLGSTSLEEWVEHARFMELE